MKLTPMQKLSQILDIVGEQIHQELDPAACKLMYNKKQLELSLPVRFANGAIRFHSGAAFKVGPSSQAHCVDRGLKGLSLYQV